MSRVIIIKGKGILNLARSECQMRLLQMFKRGIHLLTENGNPRENLLSLFRKSDRVGIKINTISGKRLSSLPAVPFSFGQLLSEGGFQKKNILIWDRTNRELKEVGYSLNNNRNDIRIFGTDTNGVGYEHELISHRSIGSLFSSIQARIITASVSLAVLKDHGLAGVTAGMKNYFGAIHNPNKYHDDNCNPFIPDLFETDHIKKKHKISIIDALVVQYHRGPSYHFKWAEKYEALIFSLDPVAADFVGWQIIEKLRAKKGLPSLKEEKREPIYLRTAEKMGLGKANQDSISIIEEEA